MKEEPPAFCKPGVCFLLKRKMVILHLNFAAFGSGTRGGNYARYNATYLIMNALGYNLSMNYGNQKAHETDIMLRDGKVVLPCYDREVFTAYLETMHTIYSEGLMEKDYYTLDKDTTKAHLTSGMYGVFSEVPGLYGGVEFGSQWFGGTPLTSEYNETPFWPNYTGQTIGQFVISADTEYPELCVALADYFYGDARTLVAYGPSVNQSDIFLDKTTGWYYDAEQATRLTAEYEANADKYNAPNYYFYEKIHLWYPDTFVLKLLADNELQKLGADEYVQYYSDYYASIQ